MEKFYKVGMRVYVNGMTKSTPVQLYWFGKDAADAAEKAMETCKKAYMDGGAKAVTVFLTDVTEA